jgi:hypothetical protein
MVFNTCKYARHNVLQQKVFVVDGSHAVLDSRIVAA